MAAATAYAALVSVMNILHDIQQHPSPPISIHPQHLHSLTQILTSLLESLGAFQSEDDQLEMRIADSAYKAEDVIESHLLATIYRLHTQNSSPVAEIRASKKQEDADDEQTRRSKTSCFFNCFRASKKQEDVIESHLVDTINHTQNISVAEIRASKKQEDADDERTKSLKFYQDLERVIEELDLINQMAAQMVANNMFRAHEDVSASAAPVRSSLSSSSMVCSDAVLIGLLDKLTDDRRDRQIIPIVGMGGSGKTTLALTIYEHKLIQNRFDVRAWITVSQKYNTRDLLNEVLVQVTKQKVEEVSEDKVGLMLRQFLFSRRYLIVMDDMWSIDAWNGIQRYFPDNGNGSRILVTTRLSQLGSELNNNYSLQMEFLDKDCSWELFSKTVFGEESCPPELMGIGKKMVENCRGLPLSIVVVGGILRKRELTHGSWESVSNNLASIVNLENEEHCLRLLKLSYDHLPLYLKPCFLYMGVFEEDDEIRVSTIVKLWVSEGFLKPVNDRSLETIAMGFLKNLVDRNLIKIHKFGCTGKIKTCKIHDLFRDLCLKEGQKYEFFHVIGQSTSINRQYRRIVIPSNTSEEKVVEGLQSMPHARSIICEKGEVPVYRNSGLVRTFHAYRYDRFENHRYLNHSLVQHVNLRHLAVEVDSIGKKFTFLSSFHLFWNLHTIIVSCSSLSMYVEIWSIWKIRQFRHIEFIKTLVNLPDPRSNMDEEVVIMENLQVLKGVYNFKCSKEVVKRIPNLKKLKTQYFLEESEGRNGLYDDWFCASNMQYLSNLESLFMDCFLIPGEAPNLQKLCFPHSLEKLNLKMNYKFEWKEDMLEKIGSLPHLEKLRLSHGRLGSGMWEIEDGRLPKLKYLELKSIRYWKHWTVQGLPCLQHLLLWNIKELEGIPREIGETLQKIWLYDCSEAVVESAKEMVEDQMDCRGDDLSFRVI